MSLIGKGSTSFKKKDVLEQKSVALGFRKIRFAHKATAGASTINLGALVAPSEMSSNGFTNPSVAQITKANIMFYRNNLKLVSSLRGLLVDQLSYVVSSSLTITFLDFTAEDGEIFQGWLDEAPSTSLSVVDGNQIVASGILLAGQTDFNIGTPIEINKNPASSLGSVMVFMDRGLAARKVGNITTGAGDYIEVPVAGGVGSLIRFNASGSDRYIQVMSNGVVAERPDGSMMAAIERVQGQVDAMVPVLASAAGVPTTTFQTGPSNVDLKQFGDTVATDVQALAAYKTSNDAVIAGLKFVSRNAREIRTGGGNGLGSVNTAIRRFGAPGFTTPFGTFNDSPTLGSSITINEAGLYFMKYSDRRTADNNASVYGISVNTTQPSLDIFAIPENERIGVAIVNVSGQTSIASGMAWLNVGDVIRGHVNPTSPPNSIEQAMNLVVVQMIKV